MVNVYILLDSGDSIAGWSEIDAAYQNKFLRLGGTALETGGSDTHIHTISITSISTYTIPQLTAYMSGVNADSGDNHNHGGGGSGSAVDANHLPAYKNFRLLYRSTDGWDGSVPAHAIGFNYNESAPDNWSSYDSSGTYFIRIASTAGGTGGAASHTHTINVQTDQHSGRTSRGNTSANAAYGSLHYHTGSATSSGQSHDYYYQNARMISCDTAASVVPGIILLFDGDPGANWTSWGSADYLLRCGNDLNTGGSHGAMTHNHGGSGSLTSGSCVNSVALKQWSTYKNIWCNHTHTISYSISNYSPYPSYVRLLAYRCISVYSTTIDKTYDFDLLIAKIGTASEDSDILVKKNDIPNSADLDAILKKKDITASASFDILEQLRDMSAVYATDMVTKRIAAALWDMSSRVVLRSDKTYAADTILTQIYDRGYVLDLLTSKAITASVNFDLLERKAFVKTFDIDALVKKLNLTTGLPADLIMKKLGIGVTYQMDLLEKRLAIDETYDADIQIEIALQALETMDVLLKAIFTKTLTMDFINKRVPTATYASDLVAKAIKQVQLTADMLARKTLDGEVSMDVIIREISSVLYSIDVLVKRFDADQEYDVDVEVKLVREIAHTADLIMKRAATKGLPSDLILKKLGLVLIYQMDLLAKRLDVSTAYDLDIRMQQLREASSAFDLLAMKGFTDSFAVDVLLKKLGIGLDVTADLMMEKEVVKTFEMAYRASGSVNAPLDADMLLQAMLTKTCMMDFRSRNYSVFNYEMGRKLRKENVDLGYVFSGYFRLDVPSRLAVLVDALFFGNDDFGLCADVVLSDRPRTPRSLRRYPPVRETPSGMEEVHKDSFDPNYERRQTRTYPETVVDPTTPDVHHDSFDYEQKERRNRNVKTTYR